MVKINHNDNTNMLYNAITIESRILNIMFSDYVRMMQCTFSWFQLLLTGHDTIRKIKMARTTDHFSSSVISLSRCRSLFSPSLDRRPYCTSEYRILHM